MKIIWENLKDKKYLFVCYCFMSIGIAVLDVGLAYVMSVCVDVATGARNGSLSFYGVMFVLYIAVFFGGYYWYRILLYKIELLIKQNLRQEVLNHIYAGNCDPHKNVGEWISLLTTDVNTVNETYVEVLLYMIPEILTLATSIFLLTAVSPVLCLLVFGITIIQMIIPKHVGAKMAEKQQAYSTSSESYDKVLAEHLQAIDTMESFGTESFSKSLLNDASVKLEQKRYALQCLRARVQMTAVTLGNFSYIGIFFVGAILILHGKMTLGALIGASQLVVYITGPMQTISQSVSDMRGGKEILNKILRVTEETEMDIPQKVVTTSVNNLQLRDVSFSYGSKIILDHANYTFVRGQHYLLQAPSGSGKSTLAAILAGKILPQDGCVCIDNVDMRQFDKAARTPICAACPQSPFIFQDTLRNNITLYNNAYSEKEIMDVLKEVGLIGNDERDRAKLDLLLDAGGRNFSGGELQRISLARLYLLHTNFVILDESMANIDLNTTVKLLTSMLEATDKTIIYISHQEDQRIYDLFEHILTIEDHKVRRVK